VLKLITLVVSAKIFSFGVTIPHMKPRPELV
jgi:hypothetical protein